MPMLALAGFKRVLSVVMYQDFMTPLTNMVLVIGIMSKINARPLKSRFYDPSDKYGFSNRNHVKN